VADDDKQHAEKDLQKLHDDHIAKIDELVKNKEAELMEV
jgi:ribosome recycling factor